ncbi:uncharacterized protein Z520_05818 [Fonsecaea multimorphosa CBS 102226]|uniref:BZIP domain-containing protein n=1 Tax=Fonsecaea multimorphosa CBS 102226 TaxID=1442371 RepID=A0A0D2JYA8_9EURO|nr:uncharacterized protein Z520_05818 [Fonsecaea multimorphosa CBS 102226]KIX98517.1 hypothetical protein Z520_05818 [Fonsecaea multimorphosa CBS 102226]OAL24711.1 hypothetical protein AYO22_05500 [Fonsecaea multimorphosa]
MNPYTPPETGTQGSLSRQNSSFPSMSMSPSSRPVLPMEVPHAKRNTINQRRCRARRQVYIEDLERRIRAYEAQGVQATTEVQTAARKVAEENRALREEVNALRGQNEALQRALAACSGGLQSKENKLDGSSSTDGRKKIRRVGPTKKSRAFDGKAFAQGPSFTIFREPSHQDPETDATNIQMGVPSTPTSSSRLPPMLTSGPAPKTFTLHDIAAADGQEERIWRPTVEEEDETSAFIPSPPPSTFTTSDPEDLSATAHHPYSPPPPAVSSFQSRSKICQPVSTANSTPCLEAALIIASMRGVPSDDITVETEILPELGCSGPLSRPRCISPEDCRGHGHGHGYSQRPRSGNSTSAIIIDDRNRGELEISTCAVDNGRLFGILARDG